ncbi:MAG TPA: hypothetical protein VNN74_07175 [Candidatus Micrarchaeia archaeon]|nr:hypothetical protein [Candidatus Micrarchaeia archaeon]
MNYQDFESAWYLGIVVTSVFSVLLVGAWMVLRRLGTLWRGGDHLAAGLAGSVTVLTLVFVVGMLVALLVVPVGQGGA